jgi:hypothetical protein
MLGRSRWLMTQEEGVTHSQCPKACWCFSWLRPECKQHPEGARAPEQKPALFARPHAPDAHISVNAAAPLQCFLSGQVYDLALGGGIEKAEAAGAADKVRASAEAAA